MNQPTEEQANEMVGEQASRPHVVMIVPNSVQADARVRKSADSAASAGLRVTVLGVTSKKEEESPDLGEWECRLLPMRRYVDVTSELMGREATQTRSARKIHNQLRNELSWIGYRRRETESAIGWHRHEWGRETTLLRRELATAERERKRLARPSGRLGRMTPIARRIRHPLAAFGAERAVREYKDRIDAIVGQERALVDALARDEENFARSRASLLEELEIVETGGRISGAPSTWRTALPSLLELERVYAPALDAMEFDLLHVHDFPLLGIGARAAGRSIRRKKRFQLLYDAHEYVAGLAYAVPAVGEAWLSLEEEYIERADAVVTVSEPIADALCERYGITRPSVVLNAPVENSADVSSPSLRSLGGFATDDKVIVYSGGLAAKRNVQVVVDGLALLPDFVKLAIVANDGAAVDRLIDSVEPDVAARISAVPFVEPHTLPSYLSEADLAVHPLDPTPDNHQFALPNKLFDYLHACLPMVVSDCRTMRDFVESHGLGVGFAGVDPASFAEAVMSVLERLDEYTNRCAAAADLRAVHTWERQGEVLLDVYGKLLGEEFEAETTLSQPAIGTKLALSPVGAAVPAVRLSESLERSGYPTEVIDRQRRTTDSDDEPSGNRSGRGQTQRWLDATSALLRCSHVIVEGGQSLLDSLPDRHVIDEVAFLDAAGLDVALLFHGPDVRLPSRHAELVSVSPFVEETSATAQLESAVSRLLADLQSPTLEALPKFVSTIDLLDYVPDAVWLPVCVERDREVTERESAARPVVVHAPASPLADGSSVVDATCRRLDDEGLIEYRRFGRLGHRELVDALSDADIVVDGIVLGTYGTVGAEAMACGATVVANLERVLGRMPQDPPIVHADPSSIEATVTELVRDLDRRTDLGHAGREFVARWHDGTAAVEALTPFLSNGSSGPDRRNQEG